jgi:hypothetical protein
MASPKVAPGASLSQGRLPPVVEPPTPPTAAAPAVATVPILPKKGKGGGDMINVKALINAMPADMATQLEATVDKNNDGQISVNELGELFGDLKREQTKNRALRWQLIAAVVFLGVSIAANFGTAMYAVEEGRKTDTTSTAEGVAVLTDKDGKELRVNPNPLPVYRKEGFSSQLPDSTFQKMTRFTISGSTGKLDLIVQGFTRALAPPGGAAKETTVTLFTPLGDITVDWEGKMGVEADTSIGLEFGKLGIASAASGRRRREFVVGGSGATQSSFTESTGCISEVDVINYDYSGWPSVDRPITQEWVVAYECLTGDEATFANVGAVNDWWQAATAPVRGAKRQEFADKIYADFVASNDGTNDDGTNDDGTNDDGGDNAAQAAGNNGGDGTFTGDGVTIATGDDDGAAAGGNSKDDGTITESDGGMSASTGNDDAAAGN